MKIQDLTREELYKLMQEALNNEVTELDTLNPSDETTKRITFYKMFEFMSLDDINGTTRFLQDGLKVEGQDIILFKKALNSFKYSEKGILLVDKVREMLDLCEKITSKSIKYQIDDLLDESQFSDMKKPIYEEQENSNKLLDSLSFVKTYATDISKRVLLSAPLFLIAMSVFPPSVKTTVIGGIGALGLGTAVVALATGTFKSGLNEFKKWITDNNIEDFEIESAEFQEGKTTFLGEVYEKLESGHYGKATELAIQPAFKK